LKVPLLDLKIQYRSIKAELAPVLERVYDSQAFILGPEVAALEETIARYCGAAFGVGISSGTDALLLALMALDVGPGDGVITSPYSFFATAGTIARVGARPIYADIDPLTYNLNPAAVQRVVDMDCAAGPGGLVHRPSGARVKALMPVHLYGQCADMRLLGAIARGAGLRVVEDAAQAIGAEYSGSRAGSFGDVGCFSFFPTKNLGAFGDAGFCTAQDAELTERLRIMRVHGGKPKYFHAVIGGNFRLDEIQAAVLNVKFRYLERWTEGRRHNAAQYQQLFSAAGLGSTLVLPYAAPGCRHIYNQFVVRVPERDRLKQHLAAHGVGSEIYYPVPLHLQECFGYLGGKPGDYPESERAARETLALPVYPELERGQLEYVVETIRRFYAQG